jgi:hypothetical protein
VSALATGYLYLAALAATLFALGLAPVRSGRRQAVASPPLPREAACRRSGEGVYDQGDES